MPQIPSNAGFTAVVLLFCGGLSACVADVGEPEPELLSLHQAAASYTRQFTFESGTAVQTDSNHHVCRDDQQDSYCNNRRQYDGELTNTDSNTFEMAIKGDPEEKRVWRSGDLSYRGAKSMAYEISPTTINDGHDPEFFKNDKIFHLATRKGERIEVGQKRYMSFAFYMPSSFQNPTAEMLIMQAWQAANSSSPPFALHVLETADSSNQFTLQFRYRNDSLGNDAGDYAAINHSKLKLTKDLWHRVVVMLIPRHDESGPEGEMRIWLDEGANGGFDQIAQVFDHFGYVEEAESSELSLWWGIYRRRQNRFHKVHFDDVMVGTTYAQVTQ